MYKPSEIKELVKSGEGYNMEFKEQLPPKINKLIEEICGFANAAGGIVIIGVDDENVIKGVKIDNVKRSSIQNSIRDITPPLFTEMYSLEIDDKTIWVIDVPAGNNKPYILSGSIYVREGANTQKLTTAEEMRAFFQTSDKIYFDEVPCPEFDFKTQIDEKNFKLFREESGFTFSLPSDQILKNLQLFENESIIKRGGVLFFGQKPEELFSQAIVRCVLYKGIDKVHIIDDKSFGGCLNSQYQSAMDWLKTKIKVSYDIEGQGEKPRKEVWEIPLIVFKEAIINALSHRDYYEKGGTIMIEVFDDRIEISNPGGLLLSVGDSFGKRSLSRNPLIFGLFSRMRLVEKVGSGVPRMREVMKAANLPEPIFNTEGIFTVTLKRLSKSEASKETPSELTKDQKNVFDLIKKDNSITYDDMVKELKISRRTINKRVNELKEKGLIERTGSKTKGTWIIR